MCGWLMDGIPRTVADNPDMETVERIRASIRGDNGQALESSMLLPCPFCGCDRPFVQTSPLGDCTEEARVVCPSCHVATTREFQSWRVSYSGDDLTRTLAIGRAISLWNRRAERTCHLIHEVEEEDDEFFDTVERHYYVCSECGSANRMDARYCDRCGARVIEEES